MTGVAKRVGKRGQGENGEYLAAGLCWVHQKGVAPGMPRFYVPGCERCEMKLAAGKVAATDPPPPQIGQWHRKYGPRTIKRIRPMVLAAAMRRAEYNDEA